MEVQDLLESNEGKFESAGITPGNYALEKIAQDFFSTEGLPPYFLIVCGELPDNEMPADFVSIDEYYDGEEPVQIGVLRASSVMDAIESFQYFFRPRTDLMRLFIEMYSKYDNDADWNVILGRENHSVFIRNEWSKSSVNQEPPPCRIIVVLPSQEFARIKENRRKFYVENVWVVHARSVKEILKSEGAFAQQVEQLQAKYEEIKYAYDKRAQEIAEEERARSIGLQKMMSLSKNAENAIKRLRQIIERTDAPHEDLTEMPNVLKTVDDLLNQIILEQEKMQTQEQQNMLEDKPHKRDPGKDDRSGTGRTI